MKCHDMTQDDIGWQEMRSDELRQDKKSRHDEEAACLSGFKSGGPGSKPRSEH